MARGGISSGGRTVAGGDVGAGRGAVGYFAPGTDITQYPWSFVIVADVIPVANVATRQGGP